MISFLGEEPGQGHDGGTAHAPPVRDGFAG
jgi:hypothetical protein